MTDASMISVPYPLSSPPTAEEIRLMAASAERQLKAARRALEIANDALSQVEDANESVPYGETQWIGMAASVRLGNLARLVADLATTMSRKI